MLTASEVAARLGVKRDTVYAYVSRGLLDSERAPDGRTSLFDPSQVDALASGRRRSRGVGEIDTRISSAITLIEDGRLAFRGRTVDTLVGHGYEHVARLLWETDDDRAWTSDHDLHRPIADAQSVLGPETTGIDRLRVAVAVAAASDPLRHDLHRHSVVQAAEGMISAMVDGMPLLGTEAIGPLAQRLWPRLTPQPPTVDKIAALDGAMTILADHGLATSTLAARVAASVRGDPYSVVAAGLGGVGGTLHGAASSQVHRLFVTAEESGSASTAVGEILGRGDKVPGFGHLVYRTDDPRFGLLSALVLEAYRRDTRLLVVTDVLNLVHERASVLANIDFALGALTFLADMAPDSGEAVFAIARTAGWIAHGLEEYDEAPLRFRPQAHYTGPRP
ncbi:MAG: citrate/2-methylcitrate synthase [Acidimicrobiales bacterium]